MKISFAALALSLLVLSPCAISAPALVGETSHNQGVSATNPVTYAATPNDELIVLVNATGAPISASVADTLGNTWHTGFPLATGSGNANLAAFYAENVSGGADTITVTFGASINSNVYVGDYSGLPTSSSFDAASTIKGAFGSAVSTNSVTPAASGELAILLVGDAGSNVTYSSVTGGFTVQNSSLEANAPSSFWGDQIAGSGAVSGGATVSVNTNWSAIVLLFNASGAPPPSGCKACFFFGDRVQMPVNLLTALGVSRHYQLGNSAN